MGAWPTPVVCYGCCCQWRWNLSGSAETLMPLVYSYLAALGSLAYTHVVCCCLGKWNFGVLLGLFCPWYIATWWGGHIFNFWYIATCPCRSLATCVYSIATCPCRYTATCHFRYIASCPCRYVARCPCRYIASCPCRYSASCPCRYIAYIPEIYYLYY